MRDRERERQKKKRRKKKVQEVGRTNLHKNQKIFFFWHNGRAYTCNVCVRAPWRALCTATNRHAAARGGTTSTRDAGGASANDVRPEARAVDEREVDERFVDDRVAADDVDAIVAAMEVEGVE